ncbi:hypothetical protein electrica_02854 [Klebsiella electrica]|nr:hypothetical protein electrica_02854 [Klebsiella electrica]
MTVKAVPSSVPLHMMSNVHSAGATINVAEFQTGIRNHRIIKNRDKALRIQHNRFIKHHLIWWTGMFWRW